MTNDREQEAARKAAHHSSEDMAGLASRLAFRLGVNIENTDDLVSVKDPALLAKLRGKERGGWYDKPAGTVYLYTGNITPTIDAYECVTLHSLVSVDGLRDALGDHWQDFCRELAESSGVNFGTGIRARNELSRFAEDYIENMPSGRCPQWDYVASFIRSHCRLSAPVEKISTSIRTAQHEYRAARKEDALRNNDYEALSRIAAAKLDSGEEKALIELGNLSDAYTCLGYPEGRAVQFGKVFLDYLRDQGLKTEDLIENNFIEKIQNPLAIFEEPAEKGGRYRIITDWKIPGPKGGYFTLSMDSPKNVNEVLKKNADHRPVMKLSYPASDWNLLVHCTADPNGRGDNIRYLRVGEGGHGFDVTRLLEPMQYSAPAMLGKKIGAGDSGNHSSETSALRLKRWRNIQTIFKNPMDNGKFLEIFGKKREISAKYTVEDMKRELAALDEKMRSDDAPEIKNTPTEATGRKKLSREEIIRRLETPITKGMFSDAVFKKMQERGVTKVSDLVILGQARILADYGHNAERRSIQAISSLGLKFKSPTDREGIEKLDNQEAQHFRDFLDALAHIPEKSVTLNAPRDSFGKYFGGADMLHLAAKMSANTIWDGCNVFLTESELQKYGLTLSPHAVRTNLNPDRNDSPVVYNLADTDMETSKPELYARVIERMKETDTKLPTYVKTIMESSRGSFTIDMVTRMYPTYDRMIERGNGCRLNDTSSLKSAIFAVQNELEEQVGPAMRTKTICFTREDEHKCEVKETVMLSDEQKQELMEGRRITLTTSAGEFDNVRYNSGKDTLERPDTKAEIAAERARVASERLQVGESQGKGKGW